MHFNFLKNPSKAVTYIPIFLFVIHNYSCKVSKPISIFETTKGDTVIGKYVSPAGEIHIQKNDVLGITVSSLNKELDIKFNTIVTPSTGNTGSIVQDPGYPVDLDGNIQMHYLGSIHVEHLTRKELKGLLEEKLSPYLKEPIVQVKFLNKKVTVLGAVEKPQVIYLSEENLSIIDALVICGDFSKYAKPDEIYIFRDTADVKQVKKLNLSDASFLKSSLSILRPNDVVYVKKDLKMTLQEDDQRRLQINMSIATSIVSVIALLFTIFKK